MYNTYGKIGTIELGEVYVSPVSFDIVVQVDGGWLAGESAAEPRFWWESTEMEDPRLVDGDTGAMYRVVWS